MTGSLPPETPDRPVRVRIAPSPTGYFHVGNARTALFNWLFARQHNGAFIWRVEDTDRQRYVAEAIADTAESLHWLGLDPTEGPLTGGPFGPYYQSQRLELYRQQAEQLLAAGHAYRCFCPPERLAARRGQRTELGRQAVYDRHCRELEASQAATLLAEGRPSVIRLKMPLEGTITLHDLLHGAIHFNAAELEDVILIKSDGYPTYHFAVVVDDHYMEISHVLRADEWISSAPYQVVLYQAFGWEEPVWAHLPMVLNPDGKGKLSKRKTVDEAGRPIEQMTQIREFRAAGYLPEAMFNFLALQGWSFSGEQDVFSREEALERFRLTDVRTAPSAWDPEKLDWMNGVYIRRLTVEDLARRLLPFLQQAGLPARLEEVQRMVPLIQERLTTLAEAVDWCRFFWVEVEPEATDLVPKKLDTAGTLAVLEAASEALTALSSWDADSIEAALRGVAVSLGLKAGPTFQPIRVAVSGRRVSPPLFESLAILGRERTLARLATARERVGGRS